MTKANSSYHCAVIFFMFLGSMQPQYFALCVCFVSLSKKILYVHSLGYIVAAFPPCENMCVRSLGYIVGAAPPPSVKICVSVH